MVAEGLAQGGYCAGGLHVPNLETAKFFMSESEIQVTNLENAKNFAKLGCDGNFCEPSFEAVTANGKERDALPNSASNIFWEEAHEMEKQNHCALPRMVGRK
jgi:hypothetical protein